jgi:hypothetical protein
MPGWRLVPMIVKSNDDLRQEQFVSQLLKQASAILREERVPVWLASYGTQCVAVTAWALSHLCNCISSSSSSRRGLMVVVPLLRRYSCNDPCGGID